MADSILAAFGPVDELRITLEIEGQDANALTVLSFSGRDTISGLASYDLTVGSNASTADKLDDALGREVVFTIEKVEDEHSLHVFRGVVDEVLPGGVAVGKDQRQSELRIVPRLHELAHGKGSTVFQNLTVTEIVSALVRPWHIDSSTMRRRAFMTTASATTIARAATTRGKRVGIRSARNDHGRSEEDTTRVDRYQSLPKQQPSTRRVGAANC